MFGKRQSIAAVMLTVFIVFLTVNFIHFNFFTVHVVLYDAYLDVVISAIILVMAVWQFGSRSAATREELALSLAVGFLISALYALSIPTIIDRSLSVYILEKLVQRGGSIRQDAFDEVLKREYFPEHRLVDIRLTEQLNSGTITIENGCVTLTHWGREVAAVTRFYRTNLLPKHREIMGQYSADLTNPFRNSISMTPYKCDEH